MKKLIISLVLAVLSCQANASYNYDVLLVPNETQVVPNPLWWTITGKCQIETNEDTIALELAVEGKGSVDGHKFNAGETMQVNAHNGDSFTLTAEPNAVLSIKKVQAAGQPDNTQTATAHCHM